jgi:hypothetical protein
MAKGKLSFIGNLLKDGSLLSNFRDIIQFIPKHRVAEAMKINKRTLDNRMADLGQFTLENFAELGESADVDDAKKAELLLQVFRQYLKERKNSSKK